MPDNNPEYYRARAEKARQMADAAHDPAVRLIHEKMATDYESLAKHSLEMQARVQTDA